MNAATRYRVKEYMRYYGANARFIANEIGLNYVNFTLWLNGKKEYSTQTLMKINAFIDRKSQGFAI